MPENAPHYLVLSGAFSNAGDFLIRHRLLDLLAHLRPDRGLVLRDRSQPLDPKDPQVSGALAIVLGGGPAWQRDLYPGIYPLADPLDDLQCPIVPLGLGWKGRGASPAHVEGFRFTPKSEMLLRRIESDGLPGTCRDGLSVQVVQNAGLTRQVLGGCPAWYSLEHLGQDYSVPKSMKTIAFSPGALHMRHPGFLEQACGVMDLLAQRFADSHLIAAFHHPLHHAPKLQPAHLEAQQRLAQEARARGLEVMDLSGKAQGMMDLYGSVDLHVGYRVHAHILRCSLRRPSLLLAEDSRGLGAAQALGGSALDALHRVHLPRVLGARAAGLLERTRPATDFLERLEARLEHEESTGWSSGANLRAHLDAHLAKTREVMEAMP